MAPATGPPRRLSEPVDSGEFGVMNRTTPIPTPTDECESGVPVAFGPALGESGEPSVAANRYQHSGRAPAVEVVVAIVLGTVAAALGGYAYSHLAVVTPILKVCLLLVCALGYGVGSVVSWRMKAGHIRSPGAATLVGLICGTVALYVAWGADSIARGALPAGTPAMLAFSPEWLVQYVERFYRNGFWSFSGNGVNVTGAWLVVFWVAEAFVIVMVPVVVARDELDLLTYCETCCAWCEPKPGISRLAPSDAVALAKRVEAGELHALAETPAAGANDAVAVRLDLARCPSCSDSNYLSLQRVSVVIDKRGRRKESSELLVSNVRLSKTDVETVFGPLDTD